MPNPDSYPNAPVVLVAVEAKLTDDGSAWADSLTLPPLRSAIAEHCPIYKPAEQIVHTLAAPIGPGGPASPAHNMNVTQVPRFMNREGTLAIGFKPDAVVVETTAHSHYPALRSVFETALEVRTTAGAVDGITRLGIRYIDEIRVPDGASGDVEWEEWVDDSLIGPSGRANALGLSRAGWQGLASFETHEACRLVLRYGARVGYAVNPEGDLKRPTPAPGPFFLLDIDSFWEPDGIPEFDLAEALERLDRLHDPVRDLFESLIKDRLREEVMSHAG